MCSVVLGWIATGSSQPFVQCCCLELGDHVWAVQAPSEAQDNVDLEAKDNLRGTYGFLGFPQAESSGVCQVNVCKGCADIISWKQNVPNMCFQSTYSQFVQRIVQLTVLTVIMYYMHLQGNVLCSLA